MRDIFGTFVKIGFIFLIAVVIINDLGAIAMTYWQASDFAQVVADAAVSSYKASHTWDAALDAAKEVASHRGVKLTDFKVNEDRVTVSIEVPPKRTLIIHRIKSLTPHLSASATASASVR